MASHSRSGDERHRPGERDQDAERGRDPLAAAKAEPDRKHVAEDRRSRRRRARPRAPSLARSPRRPRPSPDRAARSVPPAPCCRCAEHWWRRYCPSRSAGCRRARRAGSAAARTGSSRGDSRVCRGGDATLTRLATLGTLSRSAGEGLCSGAKAPLPHCGRGGTQREGAGWVRVRERHSVLAPKNRAAVDDRAPHPALHRAAVERRVLRFRAELVGRDPPGHIRVEQDEIGRRAGRQPADRQAAECAAGPQVRRRISFEQAEMADCGRARATAAATSRARRCRRPPS